MRKDGFALPSTTTIARWLQAIDLRPGVCPEITNMVKNKVEHMAEWEKNSVLMFDEMSIKTSLDYDSKRDFIEGLVDLGGDGRKPYPATHILLIMARGLTYRWKMPIAYFATNSSVKASAIAKIVPLCIKSLQSAGLKVRAVVCDQSSVNRKAATLLTTSASTPYFSVNEEKIYLIYDFPHVIKCMRNNLMKSKNGSLVGQIAFEKARTSLAQKDTTSEVNPTAVADWTHVRMLYDIDSRAVKSRATKLTEKHINPNSFEKMSVKLATQVFSLSVSTAMRTAVETGELPSSALDTAEFLGRMNNIFDSMNSREKFSPNPHKCAVSASTNSHLRTPLDTITAELSWVKTLKMMKGCKRPPCMTSMEHSLLATKLLWEDLSVEGAKYLMTGRLNQDPIENEFSVARQKCGFERNPSVRLFRQNLKHRIQAALVQPPAGANCEPDEDEILSPVTPDNCTPPIEESTSAACCPDDDFPNITDSEEEEDDYIVASMPLSLETCSVRYFTGYGVQRCLRKFNCPSCEKELTKPTSNLIVAGEETLINNKEYLTDKRNLIYPSDETTLVVDIALTVFDKMLKTKIHVNGFLKAVLNKAKQAIFYNRPDWMIGETDCYLHKQFLLKQIILCKIKRTLQSMSKELRQPGGKYGGHWEKMMKLKNK